MRTHSSAPSFLTRCIDQVRNLRTRFVDSDPAFVTPSYGTPEDFAINKPCYHEYEKVLQIGSLVLLSQEKWAPESYRVTEIDPSSGMVKFRSEDVGDDREYYTFLTEGSQSLAENIRVHRSYTAGVNQFRSTQQKTVLGTYSPRSGNTTTK